MGTVDLPKSVKTARPQARGADLPKTGENRQVSLERIFREQAARFSSQLGARLPVESIPRLEEKVYNFINQNYKGISGSFPFFNNGIISCDSRGIKMMLGSEGGVDRFNTGEIEKSTVNRQWGIGDLEAHTDNILRQKAGVGSIIDSQNANSVVACVFKDNAKKPKTVTDLRLSVNIPETELIDSESLFKASAAYLAREIICKYLYEKIDSAGILKPEAKEEAASFLESLLNERPEINPVDPYENIDKSGEIEEIRDRGFSAASNLFVSILNAVNLDCEFLSNMKEKREILIREYEEAFHEALPDEHYEVSLRYFSKAQLLEEREVYDKRLKVLGGETQRLWDMLEVIYQDSKSVFKVNDFEDLVRKNKNRVNDLIKNEISGSVYDSQKPSETPFTQAHGEKEKIRVLLAKMEERIKNISDSMYPVERQITEERLSMLKDEFSFVEKEIDPYNLHPGILVDIDLTSIKRKRTTLDSMAAALGRFLDNVSGCFRDVT
jgi:hypothetical protein